MSKIKVVYISSLGHSGSTLLDVMLNQHSDIQSVGEIIFLDKWINNNHKCTCSNAIKDCQFWNKILKKDFSRPGKINNTNYMFNSFHLFENIKNVTGKKIIIDSSKSNDRLRLLLNDKRFDIKVIHLIRNGLGVVNSLKKSHEKLAINTEQKTISAGAIKGTLRWVRRNIALSKLMKINNIDNYLKIHYEELCKDPEKELNRICNYIEVDFQTNMTKIKLDNCHNIGGGRWRYSKKSMKIQLDEKWRTELNLTSKIVFYFLGGWLNKKYGY